MPFHFPLPAMLARIFSQLLFNPATTAESRCVRWRGHELGTGEIQIALTGTFLGEAKTSAQFKLSLEVMVLDPANLRLCQRACLHELCSRASNDGIGSKDILIILAHVLIGQANVDQSHLDTLVPKHFLNGSQPSAFLC